MGDFFCLEIVDIHVTSSSVEIARVICLELKAVDNPGFALGPLFRVLFVLVYFVWVFIFPYQKEFGLITLEVDGIDAALEAGDLLGLAAVYEIEESQLGFIPVACG